MSSEEESKNFSDNISFRPYSKVKLEDVIDCPACTARGNMKQPISPAVGYCRRCKLTRKEALLVLEGGDGVK
jgi:hypothetical protein